MTKFAVQVIRPSHIVSEFIIETVDAAAASLEARHRVHMGDCVWRPHPGNSEMKIELFKLPWE